MPLCEVVFDPVGANCGAFMDSCPDRWEQLLVAPGASLGGARPKADLIDAQGHPLIAKFPAAGDDYDVAVLGKFLIVRGIERSKVFQDDDRGGFIVRPGGGEIVDVMK